MGQQYQLLNSEEIKQILQKKIEEKMKEVRPDLFDQRYVEHIITELETLQSILAEINEEERRIPSKNTKTMTHNE